MTVWGVLWIEIARESVYTFQAQKPNVQFLAIAYEHSSECERVLNSGTSLHALVVVIEIVVPDVELFEIDHLKILSVSLLYKKYNNTNCYKKTTCNYNNSR